MPNRKKAFSKKNSTRYVLLRGQGNAVNADGEKLPSENILVPVPHNYKSGSSLLMGSFSKLPDSTEAVEPTSSQINDVDLEKILESFDEADDEDVEGDDAFDISKEMSNINFAGNKKKSYHFPNAHIEVFEEDDDFSITSDQFDDAANDFNDRIPDFNMTPLPANCPETLRILNEKFDTMYEDEYNDGQIGALDDEEICGHLTTESQQFKLVMESPVDKNEEVFEIEAVDEDIKQKILQYTESDEPEKKIKIIVETPTEWDCESILSTYSNAYNHPTIIKADRKIKIPANPLKKRLTKSALKHLDSVFENEIQFDRASLARSCAVGARPKDETTEERRERRKLVKEARREIRILKKQNKLAFKEEKKLQQSQMINVRNNRGVKLM